MYSCRVSTSVAILYVRELSRPNFVSACHCRHEEIIKLEKSIMEVHEMFLDLAVLVESQGALVNNIEDNVLKTSDYMRTAVVDLEKAAESKRLEGAECY